MDRDDLIVTKWTPGPWHPNVTRRSDDSICVAHVMADDGMSVAQLANHAAEVTEANARLIAAAPDLYEALKRARECLAILYAGKSLNHVARIPSIESIDAALSRATGVL